MSAFYEIPDCEAAPLNVPPRLASWMARDHPDQTRLAAALDHAEAVVMSSLEALEAPVAIRLDVGLPSATPLLDHNDLDNYLFPLVTRLGPRRFISAWATKAHSPVSAIRADSPRRVRVPDQVHRVRTTGSAEKAVWKESVRDQLL